MKILVTGATGGIGAAVCEQLAQDGHDLAIASRDQGRLDDLRAVLCGQNRVSVDCFVGDFDSADSTRGLAESLQAGATTLDGCVLIYPQVDKPLQPFPDEAVWQRNLTTCFVRPLYLLGRVVELLRPGAKVVVVSGIASTQVYPGLYLTNAIRSAWLAQVKTLSFPLAARGIHINTVSLGGIATERMRAKVAASAGDAAPLDLLKREHELNAVQRLGEPRAAARVITQMLTNFADHVTGSNIVCDGGYSRHYG